MMDINLLPWRQNARLLQRRRRQVLTLLSGVLLMLVIVNQFFLPTALPVQYADFPAPKTFATPVSHYVGYVHQGDRTWGLLKFADGIIREVQVHEYVPEINAHVLAMNEQTLQLVYADHHFTNLVMSN